MKMRFNTCPWPQEILRRLSASRQELSLAFLTQENLETEEPRSPRSENRATVSTPMAPVLMTITGSSMESASATCSVQVQSAAAFPFRTRIHSLNLEYKRVFMMLRSDAVRAPT